MSQDFGTALTEAQRIRKEAADWMQRRAFWNWSADDEAAFSRWLAASTSHHIAYLRIRAMWDRTERLSALRRPGFVRTTATHASRKWIVPAGIAAAIAIASLAGAPYLSGVTHPKEQTFSTQVGGHRVVKLSDGSKIELNTNSVLRLSPQSRQAWLDKGEAYFQIVHDARHPFSVSVAGRRIEDLGTKFVVRTEADKLTVGLLEGKASLRASEARASAQLALLLPGDVATATASGIKVTSRTEQALLNALAWRQNMLIFDSAPLSEVVAQLNRYNARKVVISDPELAQLKVDAAIPTNGVDAFVRVARNFLGLHVRLRGEDVVIER